MVATITRFILSLLGWKPLSLDNINKLAEHDRMVFVFSHTSYADFYILLLYLLSYPNELANIRTLVKPQPFKYFGWLLRRLGAIPATKLEDSNGGSVNRIVAELDSSAKFTFLISPKGSIVRREWRSGYYHIVKSLNAELRVVGLDYEKHCVIMSDCINPTGKEEKEIKEFLYEKLAEIVPLYPDQEVVTIRPHGVRSILGTDREEE